MPPVRPIPAAITGMSDQDLADQLRELGVKLGPILPSTRRVYERKLFEMQTGMQAAPLKGYQPVDDDEEEDEEEAEDSPDEEVTIQQRQPRQRMTRSTRTEVQSSRMETRKVSPRRPLNSGRGSPSPIRSSSKSKSSPESSPDTKSEKGGLPLWVKLFAILIIAVIVFLVIKNIEPDPASNIPDQIEVNV